MVRLFCFRIWFKCFKARTTSDARNAASYGNRRQTSLTTGKAWLAYGAQAAERKRKQSQLELLPTAPPQLASPIAKPRRPPGLNGNVRDLAMF